MIEDRKSPDRVYSEKGETKNLHCVNTTFATANAKAWSEPGGDGGYLSRACQDEDSHVIYVARQSSLICCCECVLSSCLVKVDKRIQMEWQLRSIS